MAKLKISEQLLLQALFPDQVALEVKSATFDASQGVLILDIVGPTVPAAQQVTAIIQVERRTTTFKALP